MEKLIGTGTDMFEHPCLITLIKSEWNCTLIWKKGAFNYEVSVANTSILGHGGKIFALEEGSFPYELNKDVETIGYHDYGGRLTTAMTAHPKVCGETGELLMFGYSSLPPILCITALAPMENFFKAKR